jgi:hypothetical protein
MAQGHISLSIFPFLVIYANTSKSNKRSAISIQIKDQIIFAYDLAYLDHSLPPLGLFLQIKFFFLSVSQTHLFGHIERYSKRKIDQVPKTPPFSHNQNSPPQETKFCNKSILDKTNSNSTIFKILKWLADPVAFGLNFSSFGIKQQNRIIFGPLTPLPHQKLSIKSKKANRSIRMNLELNTLIPQCSGSLCGVQVHFPFNASLRLHQLDSNK